MQIRGTLVHLSTKWLLWYREQTLNLNSINPSVTTSQWAGTSAYDGSRDERKMIEQEARRNNICLSARRGARCTAISVIDWVRLVRGNLKATQKLHPLVGHLEHPAYEGWNGPRAAVSYRSSQKEVRWRSLSSLYVVLSPKRTVGQISIQGVR